MTTAWPVVELGEVSTSRLGKMLSPAAKGAMAEFPYLGNAEVRWGSLELDDLRTMSFSDGEQREFSLREGDVLICEGGEVGRTAVVEHDLPGIFFQKAIHRVRCSPRLEPQFLYRYMRFAAETGRLDAASSEATFKHLTGVKLRRLPVPLPSIAEQRRIAVVLDAADVLTAKRREAVAKLDALTQAIFIDMFGDPVANDRGWPSAQLGDLCTKIQIGPFGSLLHQSDYIVGGIPLVNPMHIVDGEIVPNPEQTVSPEKHAHLRNYWLEQGDVVMGRRGEMGRVAIVDKRTAGYMCGSGSLYFRTDNCRVIPSFVAAALASRGGRRRLEQSAQGVTMPNLNGDIVAKFTLGVPPLELQAQFAARVAKRDGIAVSQHAHLTALERCSALLQQRAFRGEL